MKCRRILPVVLVLLLSCALLTGCNRNSYADLVMEHYQQKSDDVGKYVSFTDMFLDTFGYAQRGNAIECVKSFRPQGSFKSPSIDRPTTGIAFEFIRRIGGKAITASTAAPWRAASGPTATFPFLNQAADMHTV